MFYTQVGKWSVYVNKTKNEYRNKNKPKSEDQ